MRLKVLLNEEEKEIEVIRQGEMLQISYDDHTFKARLIYTDEAHFVIEVEEPGPGDFISRKRIRAAGYRDGDRRQLWANGRLVNYRLIREDAPAPINARAASLSASIPAIVSEILVAVGDFVSAGDTLILLESMKMILPIKSPCNGVVQSINCAPGEAIKPGFQVVDIDEMVS
jgi:biotin carboxyl carrier protein